MGAISYLEWEERAEGKGVLNQSAGGFLTFPLEPDKTAAHCETERAEVYYQK